MKRALRTLFAAWMALGLISFLAPIPAHCMIAAGVFAASCDSPCCPKAQMPINCPMLLEAPSHDALITAAPSLHIVLVPLHAVEVVSLEAPPANRTDLQDEGIVPPDIVCKAVPLGRAPPAVSLT